MENIGDLLHKNLKKHFGFDSFKGNQEAIITNVLNGIPVTSCCDAIRGVLVYRRQGDGYKLRFVSIPLH